MEQFKRAEVIMLPCTDMLDAYKSSITKVYEDNGKLYLNKKERGEFITEIGVPQFLYFVSDDDEKKQGDWCISKLNELVIFKGKNFNYKKIISTTNLSLKIESELDAYYRNGFGGARPFPQPSQQFIEKFIECYNKGEIITHVLIEYEFSKPFQSVNEDDEIVENYPFNVKVNHRDNTITIKKLKDSWSRGEVIELLKLKTELHTNSWTSEDLKWIEKNL